MKSEINQITSCLPAMVLGTLYQGYLGVSQVLGPSTKYYEKQVHVPVRDRTYAPKHMKDNIKSFSFEEIWKQAG